MREPAQKFVAAVMKDDRLADHRAKPGHAVGEPFRHVAAVKRQIGCPRSSDHGQTGLSQRL